MDGAGTGIYKPDRVEGNYAVYNSAPEIDDSNVGVKETILIDGSGRSDRQNASRLKQALKK